MRAITNGIRADPQPQCGGLFGSIRGVCLFDPAIPWDTTRTLCLHEGICGVPHGIKDKVSSAIYVEAPLNPVDAF